ncbi:MAG: DUF1559 domain-containing protein [Capsulimonas sp.]|uniref:DUF1559 family PulG-like putative transporter n=1 Tax=Capsulimonas sp. TaxID=2494211 RepID=UPI0032678CC5
MIRSSMQTKGFTLIELLVVIAVISIIAAILFPVFASARGKARQASCASNERQIGMAILQYAQDEDERLPNGAGNGASFWCGEGWAGQCAPYLKSTALLRCPDDPTPSYGPADFTVSYGYNINLVETAANQSLAAAAQLYSGPPAPPGRTLSIFNAPSRTVMLFEVSGVTANVMDGQEGTELGGVSGAYLSAASNGLDNRLYARKDMTTNAENRYATGVMGGRSPKPNGQFQPSLGRHANGSNFLLADGHVKWMSGDRVSSGLDAPLPLCSQSDTPHESGCESADLPFHAAGTEANSPDILATFSTN